MVVKHFYGLGEQSVENQIFIALITYCLLVLFKLDTNYSGSLLELTRLLRTCMYSSYQDFMKHFKRRANTNAPRRRRGIGTIFKDTYQQVMDGRAAVWDELTYELTDFYM